MRETPIRFGRSFHLHHYPEIGDVLDDRVPELVHVDEEPYNVATWHAIRKARERGARSLFFTWQNLNRKLPLPFRAIERSVYRTADGAIAGTPAAADVLRAKGYRGPLWVIPQFGVEPDDFHPPSSGRPRTPGTLRVGYAGRLVEAKGVDLAMEALRGLPREITLQIVGDGPERGPLKRRVRDLGLGHRVTFRQPIRSTEMPSFYQGIDALVLPSRTTDRWAEQFGRVLVEAMACGAVCIGSRSGEIPYVIGEAGLIFPEGDVGALRGELARVASDLSLRDRLAAAGVQRVHERFTMARVADETVAAWQALLDG